MALQLLRITIPSYREYCRQHLQQSRHLKRGERGRSAASRTMPTLLYSYPVNVQQVPVQHGLSRRMSWSPGAHCQLPMQGSPKHIVVSRVANQHFAPSPHGSPRAHQIVQAPVVRRPSLQPVRARQPEPTITMRIKTQSPDSSRGSSKRILCYGDSLTAGLLGNWCCKFEPYARRLSHLLNARVDHVGLCGWDTKQMVDALDSSSSSDVKRVRWEPAGLRFALQRARDENDPYEIVIIMAGTNNLTTMPASANVANLVHLHGVATEFNAKVISVAVPRHQQLLREPKKHCMELKKCWEEVNRRLEAAVKAQQERGVDILFLDVHTKALSRAGPDAEVLFSSDGLHFSASGSRAFADTLFDMGKSLALWGR